MDKQLHNETFTLNKLQDSYRITKDNETVVLTKDEIGMMFNAILKEEA